MVLNCEIDDCVVTQHLTNPPAPLSFENEYLRGRFIFYHREDALHALVGRTETGGGCLRRLARVDAVSDHFQAQDQPNVAAVHLANTPNRLDRRLALAAPRVAFRPSLGHRAVRPASRASLAMQQE